MPITIGSYRLAASSVADTRYSSMAWLMAAIWWSRFDRSQVAAAGSASPRADSPVVARSMVRTTRSAASAPHFHVVGNGVTGRGKGVGQPRMRGLIEAGIGDLADRVDVAVGA